MIATLSAPRTERQLAALRKKYEESAARYLASLTIENFMEAKPAAVQRNITLDAFNQIALVRPDVHPFNEMLIQYPLPGRREPGKVCPDNFLCIYDGEIEANTNFSTEIEGAEPFFVLEYVSQDSHRKDYVLNRKKYQNELGVPYYLIFDPARERLDFLKLNNRGVYVAVKRNARGRCPIPELEAEVALWEGWVRFWFRGELLGRMSDVKLALNAAKDEARNAKDEARNAKDEARNAKEKARVLAERLRQLGEIVD